jgi:hypothetical protein
LDGTNRCFTPGARPLYENIHLDHSLIHGLPSDLPSGLPGRKRCALARPSEPNHPTTGPIENIALRIGDGHDRVVEGRVNVSLPTRHVLLYPALGATASFLSTSHSSSSLLLLHSTPSATAWHRLLGTALRTRVRARTLTTHGQIAAMTQPTVTPDVYQAPDVLLHFAPQVTLDLILSVNHLTQRSDLCLGQILDPRIRANTSLFEDLATRGLPNTVNVCQSNLYPLIPR